MENVRPEGTEEQSVTSPSGEALGRNANLRRSERIRKSPHRYGPGFGANREWSSDDVASIFYVIQNGDFNSNVYMDEIICLLDEWDVGDCMDTKSMFHIR